jgi:hypothetical protein
MGNKYCMMEVNKSINRINKIKKREMTGMF